MTTAWREQSRTRNRAIPNCPYASCDKSLGFTDATALRSQRTFPSTLDIRRMPKSVASATTDVEPAAHDMIVKLKLSERAL